MLPALIVVFLLLACVGYLVGVYNGLVRVRAAVKLSWSNIDVLLAQRHDELPKLVEVCKQYMQYEGTTLERVMRARAALDAARTAGNVGGVASAERELRSGLNGLYAVAENYPQLKASDNFRALQSQLDDLENKIAAARRFFNNAVAEFNTHIEQFPAVLLAGPLGFARAEMFALDAAEKAAASQAPKVSFGGQS